jgi:type IV pilus assembly protein PilM
MAGTEVERVASQDLPGGVITDGEVVDPAALGASLKDFFRANSLGKNVQLGVANQQIVVRSLEVPAIDDAEQLEGAVRFQASETIAMPLDEAVLDYQVVGEGATTEGSSLLRVVVVAARQQMVERVVDAVRGAGLRPVGIDLNAFALVRALAPPAATENDPARVYCHLAGVTNLAIAVGQDCLFTRPLATVWDGASPEFAAALAEEIRLSIDYYMGQQDARNVGELVLSGPGTRREAIADEVASLVGVPAVVAPPLGGRTLAAGSNGDPTRYTVALGLALGAN